MFNFLSQVYLTYTLFIGIVPTTNYQLLDIKTFEPYYANNAAVVNLDFDFNYKGIYIGFGTESLTLRTGNLTYQHRHDDYMARLGIKHKFKEIKLGLEYSVTKRVISDILIQELNLHNDNLEQKIGIIVTNK